MTLIFFPYINNGLSEKAIDLISFNRAISLFITLSVNNIRHSDLLDIAAIKGYIKSYLMIHMIF